LCGVNIANIVLGVLRSATIAGDAKEGCVTGSGGYINRDRDTRITLRYNLADIEKSTL
jgi:hypothetical protein